MRVILFICLLLFLDIYSAYLRISPVPYSHLFHGHFHGHLNSARHGRIHLLLPVPAGQRDVDNRLRQAIPRLYAPVAQESRDEGWRYTAKRLDVHARCLS